jgi:ABC-2 type transport system permease protein
MTREGQVPVNNTSSEGNILPSSVAHIGIITKYEMRNYFRSRRFLILLIITLLITALLTYALTRVNVKTTAPTSLDFYSFYWGIASSFVIFMCAVFFGGDAISGEFQNKTGYFLIGNPIRRSSIYMGKWIAALIASLIIIGVFTVGAIGNGVYYYGASIPGKFGESWILSIVYLMAALGLTFFFSSLFKSSAFSILVTVILLLFGFSLIQGVLAVFFSNVTPWFLLTYGSAIIGNVFSASIPSGAATVPEAVGIMLGYFIVTSVGGLFLFERKELN